MPKEVKTVRWTIEFAGSEFGKPREKVSLALKNAEERPGRDGKFSTRQIINALFESVALEKEARAARHRQQIDEAEQTRLARETDEKKLIERTHVREMLSDGLTKIAQLIRQSKLSEKDRALILNEIRAVKLDK